MVTIVTGAVAGLIATIAMTVFMMAVGDDSPPPTASLWAKYVGEEGPRAYMMQGMVLHLLYGIGAGLVFVPIGSTLGLGLGSDALVGIIGAAVLYGIVLMVVGATFWMRVVLAMEPDRTTAVMFGLFHLIYGVVLGLGIASLPV